MFDLISDLVGFVVEIILREVVFVLVVWIECEKYLLIYLYCGIFF